MAFIPAVPRADGQSSIDPLTVACATADPSRYGTHPTAVTSAPRTTSGKACPAGGVPAVVNGRRPTTATATTATTAADRLTMVAPPTSVKWRSRSHPYHAQWPATGTTTPPSTTAAATPRPSCRARPSPP